MRFASFIVLLVIASTAWAGTAPVVAKKTLVGQCGDQSKVPADKRLSNTVKWSTASEEETFGYDVYRGEKEGLPPGAKKLADDILAHDGILLCAPEYNWSVPGGLKNLIDWLSVDTRTPLTDKTALLMCATPSARGGVTGLQHLRTSLEMLDVWIYPQIVAIGRAPEQLAGAALAREADQQHLTYCVDDFIRATLALNARG